MGNIPFRVVQVVHITVSDQSGAPFTAMSNAVILYPELRRSSPLSLFIS
jgi:hypothetical protein